MVRKRGPNAHIVEDNRAIPFNRMGREIHEAYNLEGEAEEKAFEPKGIKTLLETTRDQVNKLYRSFDSIGEAFKFKRAPTEGELMSPPIVVFLGNHSSGKSTFVN